MAERDLAEHRPVPSLDRRRFLIGGLLAAGAATAYARKPSQAINYLGDRKLEDLVPKKIGSWEYLTSSGLVVPTEDALSAALYSQLVTRVYTNGTDAPMMLLVAQGGGQSGVLQIHRPEFCYPAGGFELSAIVPVPLPVAGSAIDVNRLTATLPGRAEQIVYWTRVGNHMPVTWAEQRMAVAMDNLKGLIPDAVLTRISTIDTDGDAAFARLADFAEQLLVRMGEARKILIA
ncbi:exosortase-associated protein EpsI, V-type [Sphingomonas glaciei]|uniref:EpsI family protein n=1 Tax=Sphingomonas glaciei TaxID=2938948 RepID=A0ABY5MT44_9SPHN|nr:exosortase-associated protein EpsI, V-type [Sphingomonas glaciei]UUR06956.1 EpsI family protein [Sphingomonas glaciei]